MLKCHFEFYLVLFPCFFFVSSCDDLTEMWLCVSLPPPLKLILLISNPEIPKQLAECLEFKDEITCCFKVVCVSVAEK